jgi:hypothetical protein
MPRVLLAVRVDRVVLAARPMRKVLPAVRVGQAVLDFLAREVLGLAVLAARASLVRVVLPASPVVHRQAAASQLPKST